MDFHFDGINDDNATCLLLDPEPEPEEANENGWGGGSEGPCRNIASRGCGRWKYSFINSNAGSPVSRLSLPIDGSSLGVDGVAPWAP